MKNPISGKATFFALGVAALLWVAPVGAQVSSMRLDIPFTFVAGDHALPAGQYFVMVDQDFNRCIFKSLSDTTVEAIRLAPIRENRSIKKSATGMLQFTRYGGQYFLSAVWRPGQEEGNRVAASKRLLEAGRSNGDGSGAGPAALTVVAPH